MREIKGACAGQRSAPAQMIVQKQAKPQKPTRAHADHGKIEAGVLRLTQAQAPCPGIPTGLQSFIFCDSVLVINERLSVALVELALNVGSPRCPIFPESEVERTRRGRRENGAHDPRETCRPQAWVP
jgi:hypothetical protein